MLILGDLRLSDGLQETLGYPGQVPGVILEFGHYGDMDQILVDLVAENWERLRIHFGDDLFERLNSTSDRQRRDGSEQRRHVMSALATVASRHPAIAEILREEADTDAVLRQDPHFLLWVKDANRGDGRALRALVTKTDGTARGMQGAVRDSLLDRDSWKVSDETLQTILTEDAIDPESDRFYDNRRAAIYAQLFPADPVSIAARRDLERWFETDRATRGDRDWDETLALAIGTAAAPDLPAIVTRVHARRRMGMSDLVPHR